MYSLRVQKGKRGRDDGNKIPTGSSRELMSQRSSTQSFGDQN